MDGRDKPGHDDKKMISIQNEFGRHENKRPPVGAAFCVLCAIAQWVRAYMPHRLASRRTPGVAVLEMAPSAFSALPLSLSAI